MPSCAIIGASRGIGYQFLRNLSRDPSNTVIGTARDPLATQKKADSDGLKNVHIIAGDLSSASSMYAAASKTARITTGSLDYLVITAACLSKSTQFLSPSAYIAKEKFSLEEFIAVMNTNAAGPLYAINVFLQLLRKSSIKKVIAISSGMADADIALLAGVSQAVPYAMTKAALNILIAKYAVEMKDEGIIFLSLSPGFVKTSLFEYVTPEIEREMASMSERFLKFMPDFAGLITTEESVDAMVKVMNDVTLRNYIHVCRASPSAVRQH